MRDGYPSDAIRVIANGVADDPLVRDRAALRAELGVDRRAFLAVLVAALRPEKRASMFVEQVTAAHDAEPSVCGLVVGEGPDAPAVERAARQSEGAARVLGFRADAVDIMNAADVVCLTSAVEAMPMSVLEAMSVARPVVALRVGGLPEVVADGETGLLIAPDRPSEMATRAGRPGARRGACQGTRTGRTCAPAAVVLDRGDDARLRRAPGRARPAPRRGSPPRKGGDDSMKPPHIVIVNQNALLEVDLRSRREAETLAAAGYAVTLVGGCDSPETVRELTATDVSLELYAQPRGGTGVAGQIREQNQAMVRAMLAVRRASKRTPVAAVHAGNPPDNFFLARRVLRPLPGIHAQVRVRPARRGARPAGGKVPRDAARQAAHGHGARHRAVELRRRQAGRVRQ